MRNKKLFDWKTIGMVFGIIAITSISFLVCNKAFNWFDFDQLKIVEPETSDEANDNTSNTEKEESTQTSDSGETASYTIDYSSVEV